MGQPTKRQSDNIDEWASWQRENETTKEQGPFIATNKPRQNLDQ
jgi:hypothetical protein